MYTPSANDMRLVKWLLICVVILAGWFMGLNEWAKHCIRLRGFGTGEIKANEIELSLRALEFEHGRPILIYKAMLTGLWKIETIGGYDIISFGSRNTGLIGG